MEKRTPNCSLAVVHALIQNGSVRTTHSARIGASELGLSFSDMVKVLQALTPGDFYKSMTTHANHTIWQDVYRPQTTVGHL